DDQRFDDGAPRPIEALDASRHGRAEPLTRLRIGSPHPGVAHDQRPLGPAGPRRPRDPARLDLGFGPGVRRAASGPPCRDLAHTAGPDWTELNSASLGGTRL